MRLQPERRRARALPPSWPGENACTDCRVDIVYVFRDAFLADQRLGQPVRMVDIVKTEAALDAEPIVIGGTIAAVDGEICSSLIL